jgi:hypothetical protein
VGTSVRLAHDCNNSNSAGSPDGFGLEEGGEFVLVVIGESTDDLDKFGGFGDFVLFGDFVDQVCEDYFFPLFIGLNEAGDDFGDVFEVEDVLVSLILVLLVGLTLRLLHHQLQFLL